MTLAIEAIYFALLAGPLFAILMRTRFPTVTHVGIFWSLAFVWLTFVLLANLNRFIAGNPEATTRLVDGTVRWGCFMFTAVLTAALWERWRRR